MEATEIIPVEFFAGAVLETVSPGGIFMFRARGGSMRPSIEDGDIIYARRAVAGELKPGDVIIASAGGFMRTHRLMKKDMRGGRALLRTMGDSLYYEDEPAPEEALLGKVECIEKRDGTKIDFMSPRAKIAGYIFLAAGLLKKILPALPGAGGLLETERKERSIRRRFLGRAYRIFSRLPQMILTGAKECNTE